MGNKSRFTSFRILFLCVFCHFLLQVFAQDEDCSKVICPEPLICRFPKTPIEIPDQNNKCCKKLVCTCKGTKSRTSMQSSPSAQFKQLRDRYTNCTSVDGNLELVGISNRRLVDFTKHIEEVSGYVLIHHMYVNFINLSSLRLIRGHTKFDSNVKRSICGENETSKNDLNTATLYSLYVSQNFIGSKARSSLKEIWLSNLAEISSGNVFFGHNDFLCFIDSIIWKSEIFVHKSLQSVTINSTGTNCTQRCPAGCVNPNIDKTIPRGNESHCWGSTTQFCQTITKTSCLTACTERCNSEGNCCSESCAGGCYQNGRNCYACKRFNDNGKCVQECPSGITIDPSEQSTTKTEEKFQFARYCVSECPPNRPQTDKFCQIYCMEGTFDYENNVCTTCKDGECNNICYGLDVDIGPLKDDKEINSKNIHNFNKNCTIIEGNLFFRKATFFGDKYCDVDPLNEEEMFSVFENVEEITGYLAFEYWIFENICMFKNLKRIRGKELRAEKYSLTVYTDSKQLRELCFNSLETIDNGHLSISQNPNLCYVDTIHWDPMLKSDKNQRVFSEDNNFNCIGAPCNPNCVQAEGCWGRGNEQCLKCNNFTDQTNSDGDLTPEWVRDNITGAVYPGETVTKCVVKCDSRKGVYGAANNTCQPCNKHCFDTCDGPLATNCTSCLNFTMYGECVESCPEDHYEGNDTCLPCSPNCIDGGCKGPADSFSLDGCVACHLSNVSDLYTYRGSQCQVCLSKLLIECPLGCTAINKTLDFKCYVLPEKDYTVVIVLICLLVVVLGIFLIWKFNKHRKTIQQMRQAIGETVVGENVVVENETMPLTPSGATPNQAQLRIVKENELVTGKLLGSGAFGTVFKAIWTPIHIQGEKVKIAVAVKTLKTPEEMTKEANNEIMDEAYMMASVDCIYLVRLLGVCMTEHVSLITQLMPLGSLLEYVKDVDNHSSIHSRQLLTWCSQIAKGMQYLEEKHLVHRDLAARNVLVKTPNHVKITDFGLAKLLDIKEDVYQAEGGKLPIKWLAIECITERKFSHLSDVWAFGVTCWEVMTFGSRPYEGVRAVEVLSLLERGERLPQPSIATIDVYMVLIKCWMVDRSSRPSFANLVEEFSKMASDPPRYIVMQENSSCLMSPNAVDEAKFFRDLLEDEKIDDHLMAEEPDQYLLFNNNKPEYENDIHANHSDHHPRLFSRNTPSALPQESTSSTLSQRNGESPPVSPDDVFAEQKRYETQNLINPGGQRKDSEETQRYTDEPTNKPRPHHSNSFRKEEEKPFMYDHDEYLVPTPSKTMPGPSTSSLENQTYVDNLGPKASDPGYAPLSSLGGHSKGHRELSDIGENPEYVNNDAPVWLNNEEYFATDSGIGEDSQSLRSRGTTRGPRSQSYDEGDRLISVKNNNVAYHPHSRNNGGNHGNLWSVSSSESNGQVAMDNPEYMILQNSSNNNGNPAV